MNTLISALVLLALTQPAPQPPAPAPTPVSPVLPSQSQQRSTSLTSRTARPRAVLATPQRESNGPGLWEQARAKVLVVPTPELKDENLAQIAEDMTVMCRILDKVVPPATAARRPVGPGNYAGVSFGEDEPETQGLYLGGYGALFFLQVHFPLRAPAAQQTTPAQDGPTTDPMWSQTVEELQGSPAGNSAGPATAVPYDEGRVENLKTALIRSLRHTANLRLTSAQDFITLVVSPRDSQAPLSYSASSGRIILRNTVQVGPEAAAGTPPEPASVLVLRVRKADADALAQGQLRADQFAEKVQLFWSRAYPAPTELGVTVHSYTLQRR